MDELALMTTFSGSYGPAAGQATTLEIPPANELGADFYWSARSGRAISNYSGWYVTLGEDDYLWATHGGDGRDPGLFVAALSGLTGHEVEIPAGAQTASAVADLIVAAVPNGWSAANLGAGADVRRRQVRFTGPAGATPGTSWDDRGDAGIYGCLAGTIPATFEGGLNDCYACRLVAPANAGTLDAIDVYLGANVNGADRPSWAVYQGGASDVNMNGASLVLAAGQLPADQIVADGWARIAVPPDVAAAFAAGVRTWIAGKSEANVTQIRFVDINGALLGDFAMQNMRVTDGTMDGAAASAWPSTWQGDTNDSGFGIAMAARLVYRTPPYEGDASHHSEADPAIWGTHNADVTTLTSQVDTDSTVAMGALSPPLEGMVEDGARFAVGTVHNAASQPRMALGQGGSNTDPLAPDPDGFVVVVDWGQLAGTATQQWVSVAGSLTPFDGSTLTWLWFKQADDTAGTTIRFAQDPNQVQANDPEAPTDWVIPTGANEGSEYETFEADNPAHDTDPTVAFESPFVADGDDVRPLNIPGVALFYHVPGTVTV